MVSRSSLRSQYAAHLIREVSMTSHEAAAIIWLMYNLKQYTICTCIDTQACEHKLTFVWLEL